uniref:IQ motif containing F6 n=1 Tax=Aquila chrysaetos chrysaetos TaxID=223781 RepID=A0A663F6S6_AQUCH
MFSTTKSPNGKKPPERSDAAAWPHRTAGAVSRPCHPGTAHAPRPAARLGDRDGHGAAVAIQAWWRGQLVRRALEVAAHSACRIQAWWHRAVARQREERRLRALAAYVRQEKAGVLLQARARTWRARDQYRRCREAARTIQARWRQRGTRPRGLPWGTPAPAGGPGPPRVTRCHPSR